MKARLLQVALLSTLAGGSAACLPDSEEAPTWESDIKPLLRSHCGRCHTMPLFSEDPTRASLGTDLSVDDYTPSTVASVKMAIPYVKSPNPKMRMPPPPAEPLKAWQIEMLEAWAGSPR